MSTEEKVPPKQLGSYIRLEDGTIWPDPLVVGEIEYALRYGPELTREQQLVAAGALEAYHYLLAEPSLTMKRRTEKVSLVRRASKFLASRPTNGGEEQ